jgi:hypothetical protein
MTDETPHPQTLHDLNMTLPAEVNLSVAAESLTRAALFADPALTPRAMRRMMAGAVSASATASPGPSPASGQHMAAAQHDTAMLARQAQVLDILFHRLVVKALTPAYQRGDGDPAANHYVDDARLDLALRAQRQCRNTLGTAQLLKALHAGQKTFPDEQTGLGKNEP